MVIFRHWPDRLRWSMVVGSRTMIHPSNLVRAMMATNCWALHPAIQHLNCFDCVVCESTTENSWFPQTELLPPNLSAVVYCHYRLFNRNTNAKYVSNQSHTVAVRLHHTSNRHIPVFSISIQSSSSSSIPLVDINLKLLMDWSAALFKSWFSCIISVEFLLLLLPRMYDARELNIIQSNRALWCFQLMCVRRLLWIDCCRCINHFLFLSHTHARARILIFGNDKWVGEFFFIVLYFSLTKSVQVSNSVRSILFYSLNFSMKLWFIIFTFIYWSVFVHLFLNLSNFVVADFKFIEITNYFIMVFLHFQYLLFIRVSLWKKCFTVTCGLERCKLASRCICNVRMKERREKLRKIIYLNLNTLQKSIFRDYQFVSCLLFTQEFDAGASLMEIAHDSRTQNDFRKYPSKPMQMISIIVVFSSFLRCKAHMWKTYFLQNMYALNAWIKLRFRVVNLHCRLRYFCWFLLLFPFTSDHVLFSSFLLFLLAR